MYRERKNGLFYSAAFHLLLLLLMIFGLPSLLKNEPPPEPTAITVELLPISELSNVKPSEEKQAEKPKPEEQKQEEQKKPSPPVKTSEPTPPAPAPEPAPVQKPKPETKPEPKKEEKKPEPKPEPKPEVKKEPKKKKESDLDAILKAVRETAQKEKTEKKEPVKESTSSSSKAISSRFDPSMQMSISEKDAIMGQLAKCWNPPAGAKNAHELVVVINAEFNSDGSFIKAEIASESRGRYNSDPFFQAAADAALRAVRQCSPLKNLSPEKYNAWGSMELHFDPREMLQ